jgi:hypothetical protein
MQNAISSIARLNYFTAIRGVLLPSISLPLFTRYRPCRLLAVSAVFLMAPMAGLLGESTPQGQERLEQRTYEALERLCREIRNEIMALSLENTLSE